MLKKKERNSSLNRIDFFNLDNSITNNRLKNTKSYQFNDVNNLVALPSAQLTLTKPLFSNTSTIFKSFSQKAFLKTSSLLSNFESIHQQSLISKQKLTNVFNSTKLPLKSILNKNETLFNQHLNMIQPTLINSSNLIDPTANIAYEYPSYIRNTATVIFLIILIFGTIGNILVSIIIIRSKGKAFFKNS